MTKDEIEMTPFSWGKQLSGYLVQTVLFAQPGWPACRRINCGEDGVREAAACHPLQGVSNSAGSGHKRKSRA